MNYKFRRKIIVIFKIFFSVFILSLIVLVALNRAVEDVEENYPMQFDPSNTKPWYLKGGSQMPLRYNESYKVWPDEAHGDRILNQLMYVPKYQPKRNFKIFIEALENINFWEENIFDSFDKCYVNTCEKAEDASVADAILFKNYITRIRQPSNLHQIWIFWVLESPFIAGQVVQPTSVNMTATYRLDSDIVTPYFKWVYYNESIKSGPLLRNYAANRTEKVVWFASNCLAKNYRYQYAKALSQHISVDIYGLCGNKQCPVEEDKKCKKIISAKYKFYLSFENANCRDYITEKLYLKALNWDLIPIVMGPPRSDYEKVAPHNSFIHVEDFETPKDLAMYLHYLDKNDEAYNKYFLWKSVGEFINTYFPCRLCAVLHAKRSNSYYPSITHWWQNSKTCTKYFWDKRIGKKIIESIKNSKAVNFLNETLI